MRTKKTHHKYTRTRKYIYIIIYIYKMFLLLHIYTFHKSSREQEAKNEALLHVASQISCFSLKQSRESRTNDWRNRHTHPENLMTRPNVKGKTICTSLVPSVSGPQICWAVSPKDPVADESSITKKKRSKNITLIPSWNITSALFHILEVFGGRGRDHSVSTVNKPEKSSGHRSLDLVDRS